MINPDIVIIGTGAGGGTLAYALKDCGAKILILERGDYLPREEDNWNPESVFLDDRYKNADTWLDPDGKSFKPGVHYYVGGNTKVFGAAFPRLRVEDFDDLEHEGGTAPAWPLSYDDLEPHYAQAEKIFRVHGRDDGLTDPPRSTEYPFPPLDHEPYIQDLILSLRSQGLSPSSLPIGIDLRQGGSCIRCHTCDGYPCKLGAKSDTETCCVRPALESENVEMITRAFVRRLIANGNSSKIEAVEYEKDGEITRVRADTIVVSCGAVNSAALLLHSGNLSNSSNLVGRNYMVHNNSAMMAVHRSRKNEVVFQKTFQVNDFYFGSDDFPYPMGNLQIIGKLQASMLKGALPLVPNSMLSYMTKRSIDWWVMSEDLPDPENRIVLNNSDEIQVLWKPNNLVAHRKLGEKAKEMMKAAGYAFVKVQAMGIETNSHQCGTLKMGHDPESSVLNPWCKSHEIENLFVVDSSFFPSSTAVNPALTIAAMALRVAEKIKSS